MTVQPNQGQPPASVNPLRDVNIVGGSIASSTTAKSTAAAPTYVEGADSPISQDLSGNLRISGSFSASFAESTFNTSASVSSATTIITKANTVGYYSAWVQIEGIGTSTVVCEVNNSGTWVPVTVENVGSPGPLAAITTNGLYRVPTGALGFRVRVSVYDGSATIACNLWMRAFPVSTPVGGVPVTNAGTFAVQATQAGIWTVALSAGAAVIGHVITDTGSVTQVSNFPATVDTNSGVKSASTPRFVIATDQPQLTNAFKVDGSAVTQPVSGTFWQATQPVSVAATLTTKEVRSATGTHSNIAGSASSVIILASNANRLGASIFNDSSAILYLDTTGGTASTTNYTVQLGQNAFYEIPFNYTGLITGLWASATGNARVVEYT